MKSLIKALKAAPAGAMGAAAGDSDGDDDDGDDAGSADSLQTRRNAFKMLCFLLTEVAQSSAKLEAEAAAAAAGDKPAGGRGKAKGAASSNVLATLTEAAVTTLQAAVNTDFQRLWPLGVPEEVGCPRVSPTVEVLGVACAVA